MFIINYLTVSLRANFISRENAGETIQPHTPVPRTPAENDDDDRYAALSMTHGPDAVDDEEDFGGLMVGAHSIPRRMFLEYGFSRQSKPQRRGKRTRGRLRRLLVML